MHKTSREYQVAYAEFMMSMRGFDIIDSVGVRVHKPTMFNEMYAEYKDLNDTPFRLSDCVHYTLLKSGHHKDFSLRPRNVNTGYCEDEVYCEKSRNVFTRKAVAIARQVETETISVIKLIPVLVSAMEQAFRHHAELEAEIEKEFK